MIEGVDYSGDRPSVAGLVAAGKKFVVRYGGPGGSWKHIDAAEASALIRAGLSIVANAEGAADGLLGGRSAGIDWARQADAHFRALGMPADRPIYLSVDFDVTSGQWPVVADALRGAASVIGAGRVGVYGGRRAIEWARRDRVAAWYWQTYAWSGGVWVPGNHLEQYRNHVALAGGTVDLCRAKTADYGQWGQGDDMPLTNADADLVATRLLGRILGSTGPTVGVALQDTYRGVKELQARPLAAQARPLADVDEQTLATALAPLLQPGVTVEQLREVLASVRLVPGAG
ncbi:uncharacterized protein DUF1906 [Micromonospora kangleipakensis]|uniref:Uncharacterized protein DUF1906 n=1 Tax=Micromonospora kangleipakensis TaxID=1077942 RepID=A0A4Q8BJL6_9ACTN|nr:DUF1906 domain-containing protein [Micromonospora kangleipakensis]RZU78068.1 uncharacterized protein DUF1906 [Micromonospora kangleipakensis]